VGRGDREKLGFLRYYPLLFSTVPSSTSSSFCSVGVNSVSLVSLFCVEVSKLLIKKRVKNTETKWFTVFKT